MSQGEALTDEAGPSEDTTRDLPYPRIGADWLEYTLIKPLYLDQWVLPTGTVVLLKQTENFGWVGLRSETRDVLGHIIPRCLFHC